MRESLLKVAPKGSFTLKGDKKQDNMYDLNLLIGLTEEIKQVLDEFDVVVQELKLLYPFNIKCLDVEEILEEF